MRGSCAGDTGDRCSAAVTEHRAQFDGKRRAFDMLNAPAQRAAARDAAPAAGRTVRVAVANCRFNFRRIDPVDRCHTAQSSRHRLACGGRWGQPAPLRGSGRCALRAAALRSVRGIPDLAPSHVPDVDLSSQRSLVRANGMRYWYPLKEPDIVEYATRMPSALKFDVETTVFRNRSFGCSVTSWWAPASAVEPSSGFRHRSASG